MEQIKYKKVENIVNIHEFYCDGCGKYLGGAEEYDDGYYAEPSVFEMNVYTTKWFRIRKCCCSECKEKFINKLNNFLLGCGFKEGW